MRITVDSSGKIINIAGNDFRDNVLDILSEHTVQASGNYWS